MLSSIQQVNDEKIQTQQKTQNQDHALQPHVQNDGFDKLVGPILSAQKVINSEPNYVLGKIAKAHHTIQTLNKTISNLEIEATVASPVQEYVLNGSPISEILGTMAVALWDADFYVKVDDDVHVKIELKGNGESTSIPITLG